MSADATQDQAAGLRRLFASTPPEVLSVVPCGAASVPWIAQQIALRLQASQRVLAMDERMACGNLADCVGVWPRFDLLQAAEGHVPVERCIVEAAPGFQLVPIGRLARAVGTDRVTNQRVLAQLQHLQPAADEWLIVGRTDISGLSPLALAAPRMLLAIDPSSSSVTEAYAALKRVASCADKPLVGLALAKRADAATYGLIANLQSVAKRQLGIDVNLVSSVGECLALGYDSANSAGTNAFLDRLTRHAQGAQRIQIVRGVAA